MTPQSLDSDKLPVANGKIWVIDPRFTQRVNVQAFLRALHDFEPGDEAPLNQGALDSIKRIVRFLSLIAHDPVTTDPVELPNIYNDLWRLWDMFVATNTISSQVQ